MSLFTGDAYWVRERKRERGWTGTAMPGGVCRVGGRAKYCVGDADLVIVLEGGVEGVMMYIVKDGSRV